MTSEEKPDYLNQIRDLLVSSLIDEPVTIILFGSRARGDNRNGSDVDIGLLPYGLWDSGKLTIIREKLEEMNTPYKVDIVDLSRTSEQFRTEARKSEIIWKK